MVSFFPSLSLLTAGFKAIKKSKILRKSIKMSVGTVKWFNNTKGFGFICPSDGSKDVFVHISAVQKAGIRGLKDGQKIEYDLLPGKDGRNSAENLKVVE